MEFIKFDKTELKNFGIKNDARELKVGFVLACINIFFTLLCLEICLWKKALIILIITLWTMYIPAKMFKAVHDIWPWDKKAP